MGCADREGSVGSRPRASETAARRERRTQRPSFRTSRPSPVRNAVPAARLSGCTMVAAGKSISLKDRVFEILSHVPDPEIPCISVVDLGIVRDVTDDTVTITPTYTG